MRAGKLFTSCAQREGLRRTGEGMGGAREGPTGHGWTHLGWMDPPRPPVPAPNNWRRPFFPRTASYCSLSYTPSLNIKYKYKYTLPTNTNSHFQQMATTFFLWAASYCSLRYTPTPSPFMKYKYTLPTNTSTYNTNSHF